jgi:hypothetical protein
MIPHGGFGFPWGFFLHIELKYHGLTLQYMRICAIIECRVGTKPHREKEREETDRE